MATTADPRKSVIKPDDPILADLMEKTRAAYEAAKLVANATGEPEHRDMEAFSHVITSLFNVAMLPPNDLALVLGSLLAIAAWPHGPEGLRVFLEEAIQQIPVTLSDLAEREELGNPTLQTQ